ncbi:MAG: M23 family metallopeptidase [Tidjanibacter sp.]|nr:M23 family metallopeptidase [Tidjanibacter sp.]
MSRRYNIYPPSETRQHRTRRALLGALSNIAIFAVALGATYLFYSLFDTPSQSRQRAINDRLEDNYEAIDGRYDTVLLVLDNVIERDRNVFRILFESEPYDFLDSSTDRRWENQQRLEQMSERELQSEFFSRMERFENEERNLLAMCNYINEVVDSLGTKTNYIPAIQPIINKQLTLLTAPYGMLIHPFYKTMASHQGVDFAVPVGSRVFATADGKVSEVRTRPTSAGKYIIIDHGSGYETQYRHLSRIDVKEGQTVKRGDIIGLSGNTGLSLSPHLHYEVRYKGMRVDPIHYFFMELTPYDYQRIIKIAQSGMQSFD